MGVMRGISHFTTFWGGKIAVHPITRYAAVASYRKTELSRYSACKCMIPLVSEYYNIDKLLRTGRYYLLSHCSVQFQFHMSLVKQKLLLLISP